MGIRFEHRSMATRTDVRGPDGASNAATREVSGDAATSLDEVGCGLRHQPLLRPFDWNSHGMGRAARISGFSDPPSEPPLTRSVFAA
jgi:hypothetical protein